MSTFFNDSYSGPLKPGMKIKLHPSLGAPEVFIILSIENNIWNSSELVAYVRDITIGGRQGHVPVRLCIPLDLILDDDYEYI